MPRDTSAFCRVGNICAVMESGLSLTGMCLRSNSAVALSCASFWNLTVIPLEFFSLSNMVLQG